MFILKKSGVDIKGDKKQAKIPSTKQIAESSTYAMKKAMEYEKKENRIPQDVSDIVCGFDILSKNEQGKEVRYIEVKSNKGGFPLALTDNEYKTAEKLGEKYFVYVVMENGLSDIIKDPAKTCCCEQINVVHWRLVDWKKKSQSVK